MSLNLPSRRLLKSASTLTSTTAHRPTTSPTSLLPALQSLSLTQGSPQTARSQRRGAKSSSNTRQTPLEASMQKHSSRQSLLERLSQTRLAKSIFSDEIDAASPPPSAHAPSAKPASKANKSRMGGSLDPLHLARATDPDPRSRVRWQRKAVVQMVRHATDAGAFEPKKDRLRRTERLLRSRSPFLPTSVKKLVHLARQINGMTVDEALTQMRYSKKKMAREVAVQLRYARDLAVVGRGMGLGSVNGEAEQWRGAVQGSAAETKAEGRPAEAPRPLEVVEGRDGLKGVKIQTKDGRWLVVNDPTRLYVDQAWVGRGPWRGAIPDYRARGRVFMMKRPSTSISIVLKEEKTRIREYQEREAKKLRRGPWVHLPDRPVTSQRQYYSW